MRYYPLLLVPSFVFLAACNTALYATPIVVDSFNGPPVHLTDEGVYGSDLAIEQRDIPDVLGGRRNVSIGRGFNPSLVQSLDIDNGLLSISLGASEGVSLQYPFADIDGLALDDSDVVVVSFAYADWPSALNIVAGLRTLDGKTLFSSQLVSSHSSPFTVTFPVAEMEELVPLANRHEVLDSVWRLMFDFPRGGHYAISEVAIVPEPLWGHLLMLILLPILSRKRLA